MTGAQPCLVSRKSEAKTADTIPSSMASENRGGRALAWVRLYQVMLEEEANFIVGLR